jgi:hypothetical protein
LLRRSSAVDNGETQDDTMDRRQTLIGLGALAGATFFADFSRVAAAIRRDGAAWTPRLVSAEQAALLPELVDAILPRTDTPGARDALVHVFVDLFAADCYTKEQQTAFLAGFGAVEAASRSAHDRGFLALTADERLAVLLGLERESIERNEPPEQSFVRSLKSLVVLGYFTSKPGVTESTDYELAPGPFEGCVDLEPGQKVAALQ